VGSRRCFCRSETLAPGVEQPTTFHRKEFRAHSQRLSAGWTGLLLDARCPRPGHRRRVGKDRLRSTGSAEFCSCSQWLPAGSTGLRLNAGHRDIGFSGARDADHAAVSMRRHAANNRLQQVQIEPCHLRSSSRDPVSLLQSIPAQRSQPYGPDRAIAIPHPQGSMQHLEFLPGDELPVADATEHLGEKLHLRHLPRFGLPAHAFLKSTTHCWALSWPSKPGIVCIDLTAGDGCPRTLYKSSSNLPFNQSIDWAFLSCYWVNCCSSLIPLTANEQLFITFLKLNLFDSLPF
jgi:hypothetical protein